MPQFVPVVDVETPSIERNPNNRDYDKHRKWEAPHSVSTSSSSTSSVNRGWEQGNVGWGVLGAFGSHQKDDGTHIHRAATINHNQDSQHKMIKNEKGLWIRVKEVNVSHGEDYTITSAAGKGRGRGSGIPLVPTSLDENDVTMGKSSQQTTSNHRLSLSDKSNHDKDEVSRRYRDRSRSRSDSRFRRRKQSSRSSRDKEADHDDNDDDSRKRQRNRHHHEDKTGDDDDSRHHHRKHKHHRRSHSDSRDRHQHRRDRDDSRDRHHHRHHHSKDRSSCNRDEVHVISKTAPIEDVVSTQQHLDDHNHDNQEEEVFIIPDITAVQVVNRLIEVFQQPSSSSEQRLDHIMELFADEAKISSLKSNKDLVIGSANIRQSYARATSCPASIAKRIFLECSSSSSDDADTSSCGISYCFDMHHPGTTPGLGDRSKDAILLYKCYQAKIMQVWGMADAESLAAPTFSMNANHQADITRVLKSQAWKLAYAIISQDSQITLSDDDLHYHDYDHIETWG